MTDNYVPMSDRTPLELAAALRGLADGQDDPMGNLLESAARALETRPRADFAADVPAARHLRTAAGALYAAAGAWTDTDQAAFDRSSSGIRTAFGYSLEEVAATVQAFALELAGEPMIVIVDRDGIGAL